MVATPTVPEQHTKPRERGALRAGAVVTGTLCSAIVVAVSGAMMATWQGGLAGDLLLVGTALGLLFRLPHTIPVWAALTLLTATAGALLFGDQDLAERFANLTYYGLVVGCLWALWDLVVAKGGWWLPLHAVVHHLAAGKGTEKDAIASSSTTPPRQAAGERP